MADQRPADDPAIPDDERLYIRIYPAPDAFVPTADGGSRPVTGGVKGRDKNEPISVDRASLSTPDETRNRGPGGNFHVAEVRVRVLRERGFRVVGDPTNEPGDVNPAHVLVYGSRENPDDGHQTGGFTKGEFAEFARNCRAVLILPES